MMIDNNNNISNNNSSLYINLNNINNNNNNNNQTNNNENKIENQLFESIIRLPLDLIIECITAASSIDEDHSNNIKIEGAASILIDHIRELGIECFIKRLNNDILFECCSLLSLAAANSENITLCQDQLELTFKSDALPNVFRSLTLHILKEFCECLGIFIDNTKFNNNNSSINNQKQQKQQKQLKEDNLNNNNNNILVTSTPDIRFVDNSTVVSTRTYKSTYHQYDSKRSSSDDTVIDNDNFRYLTTLLVEEIILSGLENFFYLQSMTTLDKLFKALDINGNTPTPAKMKDAITKITFKLFYRDVSLDNEVILTPRSEIEGSSNSDSEEEPKNDQNNNNRSKKKKRSKNKNKNKNENGDNAGGYNTKNVSSKKRQPLSQDDIRNEDDSCDDDDWSSPTLRSTPINFKRVNESNNTTDDEDKEIDSPHERPTLNDIKEGVSRDTLDKMYVKDLKSWLKNKKLKYSEKKNILVDRIYKALNGEAATEESEIDTSGMAIIDYLNSFRNINIHHF